MTATIASLVANHLDLWTSATQRKSGAGRGGGKRISLYGIERLRALILDLAVRGKLVPQDEGDEAASELVKRIARAQAYGSYKKRTTAKSENNPTFEEIPLGWEQVQVGDVFSIRTGFAFKSSTYSTEGTLVFRVTNFDRDGTFDLSDSVYFPTDQIDEKMAGFLLEEDDIIMVMVGGTIGKTTIIDNSILPALLNQNMWRIRSFGKHILSRYEYLLVKILNSKIEGLTQSTHGHFAMGDFTKRTLMIPPLAEQQRIVAKVDELMAHCDALERESAGAMAAHQALVQALLGHLVTSADAAALATNWARLESHFDTLFTTEASIEALKQTILDLAVRGKLIAQDAEDETASTLLKQLKSDRSRGVGKLRGGKPKVIAPILDGSEPYELPIGWLWARVADVFHVTSGGTVEASLEKDEGAFPYLKVADLNLLPNDVFIKTSSRFIDPDEKQMRGLIQPNSIIFPKRGGAIATNKKRMVTSGIFVDLNIMAITVPEKFSLKYVYFWLQGIDLVLLNTGTSVPQINHQDIDPLPFPIPPLAEQHRIVAKVDALMALCDALKANLADAATTQKHLADAITERAAA